MGYTDCIIDNDIKYCKVDDYLVVGTGYRSGDSNALSMTYSGKIRIPSSVNGVLVKEISASAFSRCRLITSVYIEPGITKIGSRSFADCYSLNEINIPSTVESIGNDGIQFYNVSSNNRVSTGTCIVHFEKNYVLKEIGSNCFKCKENVILYFENPVNAKIGSNCFYNVTNPKILSPVPFKFAGHQSYPKKLTRKPSCRSTFATIFLISLSIVSALV